MFPIILFTLMLFTQTGFSQTINIQDTYVNPRMMSSSDGTGGSTSTYFHLYRNQVEKVNKRFNLHETYTIIDKKKVGNNTYYTLKGNNKGTIVNLSFQATKNNRGSLIYELVFEVPGEFKERYFAF
ncbi:MAG: hypothetical protein EOO85_23370 [Pedobacter sp.]|nr:MAG: hypothetical protein EOO85_23370 [Pedobacter sp.]